MYAIAKPEGYPVNDNLPVLLLGIGRLCYGYLCYKEPWNRYFSSNPITMSILNLHYIPYSPFNN